MLLFADDVTLLSKMMGLQNQPDHLKKEADRLYLTVNLDEMNVMIFRTGGHLVVSEKWLYGNGCGQSN